MDFIQKRLQVTIDKKYIMKKDKLNSMLDFATEYEKPTNILNLQLLKQYAFKNFMLEQGIVSYDNPDFNMMTEDRMNIMYRQITDKSKETFCMFYESYMKKIDNNYFTNEILNNAFDDLIQAYKLYRLTNNRKLEEEPSKEDLQKIYVDLKSSYKPIEEKSR
jgi:hypothetical protein